MSGLITCLQHGEIVHAMQKHCVPNEYYLTNTFFPRANIRRPQTDIINLLEFDTNATGVAQFNSQCAKANVIATGESVDLKSFKIPYVHEMQPIAACNLESILLNMNTLELITNPADKYRMAQAWFAKLSAERVKLAMELMAAEIIRTGKATIKGDNIPTTILDFGRDPALNIVLSPDDQWCAPSSHPIESLEALAARGACNGVNTKDVYFTPNAWQAFRRHPDVIEAMKGARSNTGTCMECVTNMTGAPVRPQNGITYQGFIGNFDLYVIQHQLKIKNEVGTTVMIDLLDNGDIYLIDKDRFMGMPIFGAIRDAFLQIVDGNPNIHYWAKVSDNPKGVELHYETKPMLLPGDVNAVIKATVVGAC